MGGAGGRRGQIRNVQSICQKQVVLGGPGGSGSARGREDGVFKAWEDWSWDSELELIGPQDAGHSQGSCTNLNGKSKLLRLSPGSWKTN